MNNEIFHGWEKWIFLKWEVYNFHAEIAGFPFCDICN